MSSRVASKDPPGGHGAVRILLADDHEIVRKGLRHILEASHPGAVYGEASNPGEIIRLVRDQKWDLVILGASIPGRGGLEVLKDIRKLRPTPPVLIMSLYVGELLAVRALRAGAAGYVVTRQTTSEDIVAAVRKIISGGQFVPPSLAERLVLRSGVETVPHEGLSDREFQVFRMLAAGLTVKNVAERLHLSPQTVSTYRGRILEKMKMETTADFVRYAVQHRLLDECFGPAGV